MTIISAFNKPKITPQILDKKYLKKFQKHSKYESYINNSETILPNVSYCVDNDEVHYNPGPYNGHAYVDLGLPSGTKWATMNIGAISETDYGLYFAWGETKGYAASQVGTGEGQKIFSWIHYKWSEDEEGSIITKYNVTDDKTMLDLADDAAHVNWDGDWHMPTKEQCEELLNTTYVINAWVENYQNSGVNGRLFTSVHNNNTLFIPAAGICLGVGVYSVSDAGSVWISNLDSENINNAWCFSFINDKTEVDNGANRYYGQSVRGVIG